MPLTTDRRPLFLAAAALVATGLIAWCAWPTGAASTGPECVSPRATAAAPVEAGRSDLTAWRRELVPALAAGVYSAPVGTELQFEVDATATTRVQRQQDAAGSDARFALQGQLRLAVLARRGDEVAVEASLPQCRASMTPGDQVATAADEQLHASLRAGAIVRMGSDGALRGFRFPATTPAEHRNLQRTLFRAFAFVVADAAARQWTATEVDGIGSCRVRYERTDDPAAATTMALRKTRLDYERLAQPGARAEIGGSGDASIDRHVGWLVAASDATTVTLQLPDAGLVVRSTSQSRLRLQTAGRCQVPAALDWDAAWLDVDGAADAAAVGLAQQQARFAALLQGTSLERLLLDISQQLAAGRLDGSELARARELLVWLVRLQPQQLAALRSMVTAAPDDPLSMFALSAVGAAGSEPAQQLLAELAADAHLGDGLRLAAVQSLFQVQQPVAVAEALAQSVATDASLSADLRLSGLLLMGAFAGSPGSRLLPGLLGLEAEAGRQGLLPAWLDALGNAGGTAIVEPVLRHLGDDDVEVRLSAILALRRVGAAADPILVQRGLSDPAPAVRAAAAGILAGQPSTSNLAALAAVLQRDQDENVRRAVVAGLGAQLDLPEVVELLARVARSDAVAALREQAAALLARG